MNFIKVKFLKNGVPFGRSYTYASEIEVNADDMVQIDEHKKGIVTDEIVDMNWVNTYGAENLKKIIGKVEKEDGTEEKRD